MTTPTSSRVWRAARWALLVAGAIGVAVPAPAQFGRLRNRSIPTQPASAKAPNLSEAQLMLTQFTVELAWLTDPATFPWPLTARVSGTVLHVSGEVPSQAIRQQALKIAGEHCSLAVIDGLKVNAALVRPTGAGGDEALEKTATDHLRRYMGEQVVGVHVSARVNGQVAVTGSIGSHEEKLAVSQSLRAVAGCTSVVNQLAVGTTTHEGRPYSLVSADGRLLVPGTTGGAAAPVKSAVYSPPQESGGVSAAGHQERPASGRWGSFNPLRAFGRSAAPAQTETPKPTAPASLPPSMQSGGYRDLANKTTAASTGVTPASASVPRADVGLLQRRIRQACGAAVVDVQITPAGEKNLKVQVKIKKAAEAEALAGKILALPELVPFEVSLSMTADK